MLGNSVLEVRLAGIMRLNACSGTSPPIPSTADLRGWNLCGLNLSSASVNIPTNTIVPIMKPSATFVVQASRERPIEKPRPAKSWMDTEAIMEAIRDREEAGIRLEWFTGVRLELDGAYLRGVVLRGADLRTAQLPDADLMDADLSYTLLDDADLSGAWLGGADLSGARMSNTNLSGAILVHGAPNSMDEDEVMRVADLPNTRHGLARGPRSSMRRSGQAAHPEGWCL